MPKKAGDKTSKELYMEFQRKSHEDGFITFAMKVIGELEAERKPVVYYYRAAIRSFLMFTKGKEVPFEKLTSRLAVRYNKWLDKEGILRNTAANYLRTLQTIYNKAVKEGVVDGIGQNPFGGVNKTVKKADKYKTVTKGEQEKRWFERREKVLKFLQDNDSIPTQASDAKLYHWLYRQEVLLKEGKQPETRLKAYQELAEKISQTRCRIEAEKRRKEELTEQQGIQQVVQVSDNLANAVMHKRKSVSQDRLWNNKWRAYMRYMEKKHARPSKYKAEDMVLFDWFKHSKKLLRRGLMKPDRVEKFQRLLDEAQRLTRNTVYYYANGEPADQNVESDETVKEASGKGAHALTPWTRRYNEYAEFLKSNGRKPSSSITSKDEHPLYMWLYNQKSRLKKAKLTDREKNLLAKLLPGGEIYEKYVTERKAGKGKTAEIAKRKGLKSDFHLYDYQQDMKGRIENTFKSQKSVMVQMPTGTGKTHVIAAVTKDFVSKGATVWIVAHRRELVAQIRGTLTLYLGKREMGHVEVRSVQWLTRHISEVERKPSLIVIDEAHHALAKTYSFLMTSFPEARKLGVTATPYRLSGEGFTDLFDTLLAAKSVYGFMAEGRLSLYDYYTVGQDDEDLRLIRSIRKHGTDGDYDPKELDRRYNQAKTIGHLYDSFKKYASDRRGFVYAMNISHAESIAACYVAHGVKAVAVSSHTPKEKRHDIIEAFKKGDVQVLVSVDLFSEGIDVTDADFIQLARPTLSLAKHLQMVGRGLRVAEGKDYCVIIDNVGNYWNFGLPSDDRDWNLFFKGYDRKKVQLYNPMDYSVPKRYLKYFAEEPVYFNSDKDNTMMKVCDHVVESENINVLRRYHVVTDKDGNEGIGDDKGCTVVPCEYKSLEIDRNGIVELEGEKHVWLDLHNGLRYARIPHCCRLNGFPIAFAGNKAYPRIRSRFVTEATCFVFTNNLPFPFYDVHQWNDTLFVSDGGWHALGIVKAGEHGAVVCENEEGGMLGLETIDSSLVPIADRSSADSFLSACEDRYRRKMSNAVSHWGSYVSNASIEKIFKKCTTKDCGYGVFEVTKLDGERYWLDTAYSRRYGERPRKGRIGIMDFVSFGNVFFFPRQLNRGPLLKYDIHSNFNVCLAGGIFYKHINSASSYISEYKITKIADDHTYMDIIDVDEPCRVKLTKGDRYDFFYL